MECAQKVLKMQKNGVKILGTTPEVIDLADKLIKAGLLEKYDERTDI